eukprot:SAG25_NODE_7731_length_463_cov_0.980769_1_plen_20_part_01
MMFDASPMNGELTPDDEEAA